MGKQSARLYYDGKDHKDIFFRGKHHEKMCKGSLIVWEKLYPDAYFVGINQDAGYITVISNGYADVKNTLATAYTHYFTNSVIGSEFYVEKSGRNIVVTRDLIHFKDTGERVGDFWGVIKNKFFFRNFVVNVGENLECKKTTISYPSISDLYNFYGYYYNNFGNYGILGKSYRYGVSDGTYIYLIVNENGVVETKSDIVSLKNDGAQAYAEKLAMTKTMYAPYGNGLKIVFGDCIYYAVNGGYIYYTNENKSEFYNGRIIKRNLLNFKREIVYDFGTTISGMEVSIDIICFMSYERIVTVCSVFDKKEGVLYPYVLTINASSGSVLKPLAGLSVRVYGENRKIDIIPVKTTTDIKNDSLYFFYNYVNSGGKRSYGLENFRDSYYPSINKGTVELDSVGGMAVAFYSETLGYGYIYFDNLDFLASENNYVYFIEN